MNQQTKVNNMQVKTRSSRMLNQPPELIELPARKQNFGVWFFQLDSLVRNLAVVGGLVLIMVAVKNSTLPETKSVFSAIQESAGMQWDESVGKLSFVNSLLPEEILEVWNDTPDLSINAPSDGEVIHSWSQHEPYLMISHEASDVYASADGEVMSIAHGLDEERIIRIRHENCETIYGNMENVTVEVGDLVASGDLIGTRLKDRPLTFEMRYEGRSVDPALYMRPIKE